MRKLRQKLIIKYVPVITKLSFLNIIRYTYTHIYAIMLNIILEIIIN